MSGNIHFSDSIFYCLFFLFFFILIVNSQNSRYKIRGLFGIVNFLFLFFVGVFIFRNAGTITYGTNQEKECLGIGVVKKILPNSSVYRSYYVKTFLTDTSNSITSLGLVKLTNWDTCQVLNSGDVICFYGTFRPVQKPLNPGDFDYSSYLKQQSVYYETSANGVLLLRKGNRELNFFSSLKLKFQTYFKRLTLDPEPKGVLNALVLGDKAGLDQKTKDKFAKVGAMHVLAVSGLHVGIIYLLANLILKVFPESRLKMPFKNSLIILVIWTYAMITGFSPSVIRASTMFSCFLLIPFYNKHPSVFDVIFFSCFFLLAYNPLLIYDLGFLLSYSAVLGIVLIFKKLNRNSNSSFLVWKKIKEISLVSISAQISTLPFAISIFHFFPVWFLISNLIVIPFAFLLVVLGVIGAVLYMTIGSDLGIAFCLQNLLDIMLYLIDKISLLPVGFGEDIWISNDQLLIVTLFIVFFVLWLYFPLKRLVLVLGILLLVFISSLIVHQMKVEKNHFLSIYSYKNKSVYCYVKGETANVYADQLLTPSELGALKNHLYSRGVEEFSWSQKMDQLFSNSKEVNGIHLVHLGEEYFAFAERKLELSDTSWYSNLDVLVLTNLNKDLSESRSISKSKKVIFDASVSGVEKPLKERNNVIFVAQSGYLEIDL